MTAPLVSTAVDRALGILEILATEPGGLSHSEISRRLEIPKSTASYLLRILERRGYLRREPDRGKYHLGLQVLSLSRGVQSGMAIHELVLPVLRQLVERCRLTAHLAVLDHGQAVYVEKVEAPSFIKMDTWVGRRMDVHSTSVGKALVAFLPREELEALLRQHGLRKHTPSTITALPRFLGEMEKVRAQGYAVDNEENSPGVLCVAAPIFDSQGEVGAAVGISGATSQLTQARLPEVVELVVEAARKLSRELGYRPAAARRLSRPQSTY